MPSETARREPSATVWILWEAQDGFFSPRLKNSNARTINREAARDNVEVIFEAPKPKS